MIGRPVAGGSLDFFVSYARPDEEWAAWIGQQLIEAGYSVEIDVWDWAAGTDVIAATERAMDRAGRVLGVWSPAYFERMWAQMEHRAAFAAAQPQPGLLVPVVVRDCLEEAIPRLYRTLMRVDLVALPEVEARQRLLAAVAGPQAPAGRVPFPGTGPGRTYPGRLPPVWNVPGRRLFQERAALVAQLRALLAPGPAEVALAGEAGTGKSQLAVEYAWRHSGEFGLVWWVDAGPDGAAEASLLDLAALLELPVPRGAAGVVAEVYAALAGRDDWLLILDDIRDGGRLAQLRPPPSGRLIMTSRQGGLGVAEVVAGRFSRAESVGLLSRRCPGLSPAVADRVAALVDDLPVAVGQAASFLAQAGAEAERYLPRLTGTAAAAPDAGEAGLAVTVAVAVERLAVLDPLAADLLDQLALLAPEAAPLTATGGHPAPGLVVGDPDTTREIVSKITGLGLAERAGTTVQLHSRVHAAIARILTGERRATALGRALRLLGSADPGDPTRPEQWRLYATLTPHVTAAVAALAATPGVAAAPTFERLLAHTCQYRMLAGHPGAGHELAAAAYRRHLATLGPDHPDTLRWGRRAADCLGALGRHDQAQAVLADILQRQRHTAGPDDPETLRTAESLGTTLAALGRTRAAQRLLQDTLDRRRATLGPDAPETLQSATDVGVVLRSRQYHEQARLLLEDAYTRRRRTLGADALDTLGCAHELGLTLAALGDQDSARHLLDDTAARRRAALGADHPDTLRSTHALGLALAALGDHDAARAVLDDTTTRRRAALGADDADTLDSAHTLGVTLAALGEHDTARAVLQDTTTRRRRTLSPDHPDALSSADALGQALTALGDHDAAHTVLDDTLDRRRRLLGSTHPDTLHTESNQRRPRPTTAG